MSRKRIDLVAIAFPDLNKARKAPTARKSIIEWQNSILSPFIDVISADSFGFLYLLKGSDIDYIEGGVLYKIGRSLNPRQRADEINKQVSFHIELVHMIRSNHYIKGEYRLHKIFIDKCVNGEWFNLDQIDIDHICSIDTMILNYTHQGDELWIDKYYEQTGTHYPLVESTEEKVNKSDVEGFYSEVAIGILDTQGRISTSLLQRRLHIGYKKAKKIIRSLIDRQIISEYTGNQKEPYKVLSKLE